MNSPRKTRWLAVVLAVAVLGIAGWWVMAPREPSYQGKAVGEWYSEIRVSPTANFATDPACVAIKAIGKDATPFILRELHGVNSPFHNSVAHCVAGLPKVMKVYHWNRLFRLTACLNRLGVEAEGAVPELIEVAKGRDSNTSGWALHKLGEIHSRPDIAIPFLIEVTQGTNRSLRFGSLEALAGFGSTAKPAVPNLISQWQGETNSGLRYAIGQALQKIDPEVAAKAGIK